MARLDLPPTLGKRFALVNFDNVRSHSVHHVGRNESLQWLSKENEEDDKELCFVEFIIME